MTATAPTAAGPRTYGNYRRPATPGLGPLGWLSTLVLLGGVVVVILVVALVGVVPALVLLVAGGLAFGALVLKDRHGRSLLARLATRAGWWRTRRAGSHLYRSGPLGAVPLGTFSVPGLLASSTLSEHEDSWGRRFGLLQVGSTRDLTVVLATEPDGASLVDPAQVDSWVSHWGQWLAALGDEPGLLGVAVTVETAPDSGARLRREVTAHVDPDGPVVARAMLAEVAAAAGQGSAAIRAWVALTFSAARRAGGPKRTPAEAAHDLASRLTGLTSGLHATGAGAARPVTAQELCELVRTAYDPAAARVLEDARTAGEPAELLWSQAGPAAAEASWDSYAHDGAVSTSWVMSGAPRGAVQAGVLAGLLAPHRDVDRKRVTLLYKPLDSGRAARIVEADKRTADFRASSARPSARALTDQRSAHQAAAEEAAGAGLVDFGMVVTATVTSADRLPEAHAAIDTLSASARLQLRPAHGSQDSAFLLGLPLGLVPARHSLVSDELRAGL